MRKQVSPEMVTGKDQQRLYRMHPMLRPLSDLLKPLRKLDRQFMFRSSLTGLLVHLLLLVHILLSSFQDRSRLLSCRLTRPLSTFLAPVTVRPRPLLTPRSNRRTHQPSLAAEIILRSSTRLSRRSLLSRSDICLADVLMRMTDAVEMLSLLTTHIPLSVHVNIAIAHTQMGQLV